MNLRKLIDHYGNLTLHGGIFKWLSAWYGYCKTGGGVYVRFPWQVTEGRM